MTNPEDTLVDNRSLGLQSEIDERRRQISTDGYPISVGELINLYRDRELDIHPEFQRFFRWSLAQRSRLIESLLLGIPIPSIFVNQRADGVWDVVDGLQRLSTIFEFAGILLGPDGTLRQASRLERTEYLPSLEGMVWESDSATESFTAAQRLFIKRAAIDVKIIKRESDPNAKFDLFQRLNTGGSQLSQQELRNCLLIMVDPAFYEWLTVLRSNDSFQAAAAQSDRSVLEQYDLELVVRFLALVDLPDGELKSIEDMHDFLTKWSRDAAVDNRFDRAAAGRRFGSTFDVIFKALGEDAFRRYDEDKARFLGGFSVSAFEAVSVGVASNLDQWTRLSDADAQTQLTQRVKSLWSDPLYKERSGSGIRASGRVPHTIPLGRRLFNNAAL